MFAVILYMAFAFFCFFIALTSELLFVSFLWGLIAGFSGSLSVIAFFKWLSRR